MSSNATRCYWSKEKPRWRETNWRESMLLKNEKFCKNCPSSRLLKCSWSPLEILNKKPVLHEREHLLSSWMLNAESKETKVRKKLCFVAHVSCIAFIYIFFILTETIGGPKGGSNFCLHPLVNFAVQPANFVHHLLQRKRIRRNSNTSKT